MKPGFMTSVCPKQTLPELIATAQRYAYEGIEFRVEWNHKHGIELSATKAQLREAKQALADGGIAATCIATSVHFNSPDPAEHPAQRETLRKYIALAAEVGAPYLRTFSDSVPEDDADARDKVLALAAADYAAVDDWATQHGVQVLVETHTNMRGEWARQIIDQAKAKSLGVLWDIFHHLNHGQSVDEAYPFIKDYVRHLHFHGPSPIISDSENQRCFDLLAMAGFSGFFSVEVIDPDDPDGVLQLHIDKFHEYMSHLSYQK